MTKQELMKDIGTKLKSELNKKSMSQNELARRTGLSKSTISDYIRGDKLMTIYNLTIICQVLECRFSDIAQTVDYVER